VGAVSGPTNKEEVKIFLEGIEARITVWRSAISLQVKAVSLVREMLKIH